MIKRVISLQRNSFNYVLGKVSSVNVKQLSSIQKDKVNIAQTKDIYFCAAGETKPVISICSTTALSPQLGGLFYYRHN